MRMAKLYLGVLGLAASAILLNCCIPTREASCNEGKVCNAGEKCNLETQNCEAVTAMMEPPEEMPKPKPCTKQSDCGDQSACSTELTGQPFCMDQSSLVFVQTTAVCGAGNGTYDAPYCSILEALSNVQRPSLHLRLLPSGTTTFGSLDLGAADMGNTGALFIHGSYDPGSVGSPAELSSVKVSAGRSLTLIDVHLGQSSNDAATCLSGGYLTILRSRIAAATGLGINATSCANLTVDRAYIEGNKGGAISLAGTPFSISNSYIVANGSATLRSAAVTFMNSDGHFEHNTVSNNISDTSLIAGGINCRPGISPIIANSIIFQNTLYGGTNATQFQNAANCTLKNTVVGSADKVSDAGQFNLIHKDPFYVVGTYLLTLGAADNDACCLGKAGTRTLLRAFDFWGATRPTQGPADIGAEELP